MKTPTMTLAFGLVNVEIYLCLIWVDFRLLIVGYLVLLLGFQLCVCVFKALCAIESLHTIVCARSRR